MNRVNWLGDGVFASGIRFANEATGHHASPSPKREVASRPVIACRLPSDSRGPAKFSHGYHEGVFQKPAFSQIVEKCR
jgi:hypothetical protein